MDLNELLYAHQVAVMRAASSTDENHFNMIAEYADRIRQLRSVALTKSIAQDPFAPPTIIYGSYAGDPSMNEEAADQSQAADGAVQDQNENPGRGKADV